MAQPMYCQIPKSPEDTLRLATDRPTEELGKLGTVRRVSLVEQSLICIVPDHVEEVHVTDEED